MKRLFPAPIDQSTGMSTPHVEADGRRRRLPHRWGRLETRDCVGRDFPVFGSPQTFQWPTSTVVQFLTFQMLASWGSAFRQLCAIRATPALHRKEPIPVGRNRLVAAVRDCPGRSEAGPSAVVPSASRTHARDPIRKFPVETLADHNGREAFLTQLAVQWRLAAARSARVLWNVMLMHIVLKKSAASRNSNDILPRQLPRPIRAQLVQFLRQGSVGRPRRSNI